MNHRDEQSLRKRLGVVAVALATCLSIQSQPALAQAPSCSATQTSFPPNVGNGSTTDGSQPFSFTVPAGVTSVTIDARGAQAGFGSGTLAPQGAQVVSTVTVSPGDVLCVIAGVRGQDAGQVGG